MKIVVIGAGAWGTALAASAAQSGHAVSLLARDAQQAALMQSQRSNERYLPSVALPKSLCVIHGEAHVASTLATDLIIIATPMAGLQCSLMALQTNRTPVAWLCKGFDKKSLLGHEIAAASAPESVEN